MKESRHANFGAIQAIFLQLSWSQRERERERERESWREERERERELERGERRERERDNLHILHSLGTLYHRPIFTSNGRHPALSKVISDLDLLLLTLDTKASV